MKPVILDTGVIVALLDKSETYHKVVCEIVTSLASPLVTCEAVIAESCFLLRKLPRAAETVLQNVEHGIFTLSPCNSGIRRIREIIAKYRSVPADYADACLVFLAETHQTGEILTLDSDFSIYRWGHKRAFNNIVPL